MCTGCQAIKANFVVANPVRIGEEMVAHLMGDVGLFLKDHIRGEAKSVIRLPDGIRGAVAREVDKQRSEGGELRPMQLWVLDALVW